MLRLIPILLLTASCSVIFEDSARQAARDASLEDAQLISDPQCRVDESKLSGQMRDDFSDSDLEPLWEKYCSGDSCSPSARETSGSLTVGSNTAYQFGADGILSQRRDLSLSEDKVHVEVLQVIDNDRQGLSSFIFGRGTYNFRIEVRSGELSFRRVIGSNKDVYTEDEIIFDRVDHRFWQIRFSGNTVFGEVGPALDNMRVIGSHELEPASEDAAASDEAVLTSGVVYLASYLENEEVAQGSLEFDNFNINPACSPTSE